MIRAAFVLALFVLALFVVSSASADPQCIGKTYDNTRDVCLLTSNEVQALTTPTPVPTPTPIPPTATIVIENQSNVVVDGTRVTNTVTDCVTIRNSTNITVKNAHIGPCGGNGVAIYNSTGVKVLDSYVHTERAATDDTGNGVHAVNSFNLLVQGNVLDRNATNVQFFGVRDSSVHGNYTRNPLGPYPRGHQISVWSQVWTPGYVRSANVNITKNYVEATSDNTTQTDAINIGPIDGAYVAENYVTGGRYPSGCGILAADNDAQSVTVWANNLYNTGQCGIGLGSGQNHVVEWNKVLNLTPIANAGNTAIYVWKQYPPACGPIRVANNTATQLKPDGVTHSGWWNGGGCEPVTEVSNTWNEDAYALLAPSIPPPSSVPPEPFTNKVASPYTR